MKGFGLQLFIALTTLLWTSGLGCHIGDEDLRCTVDYLKTMSCCWSDKVSKNARCTLWVDDPDHDEEDEDEPEFPKTCTPKSEPGSSEMQGRSCNLTFLFFAAGQTFNMTLLCPGPESQAAVAWIPNFKPLHNIKLKPPYNLTVTNNSQDQTDFSWMIYYEMEFGDKLQIEMRYKTEDEQWTNARRLRSIKLKQQAMIDGSNLKPNRLYMAQIRNKIVDDNPDGYRSTWSEWSQEVKWKSAVAEDPDGIFGVTQVSSLLIVGILIVFAILVILTFTQLTIRRYNVKKLHWLSIPDPGKFFYELNATYGGNFQKWLGSTMPASFNSTEDLGTEISSIEVSDIKDSESFIKQDYVSDSSGFKSIGNSSLSSFANQGYFWFRYPSTYEVDSCKVYFSYDRSSLRSGSEGSGSYLQKKGSSLTLSNDSLYDSSQQYSPCSVFITDPDQEYVSPQVKAGQRTLTDEEMDGSPRGPEGPGIVTSSGELGYLGQLLRDDCPPRGSQEGLNPFSQMHLFENLHYPFVSVEDVALTAKEESISKCGCDGFTFNENQMESPPINTENTPSAQCPQDGLRQESTSIFKSTSLNLGQSSDVYLSLKEVQSKYSNQSI
ncbi:interleukin-2 receptor subunit beta-like [Chiloscyllium plagiosum]|uniref:interleukin-2 receptor subunit beta-like n=1 Tax=Chiloscyllium plagiosum TaxID=36176 RepID=UPI001CB86818|nr:interleukin-2 receptor subunit beta-like [Chiloscyllium plagiosum]XP_043535733.1 interleukin-2 receptor subunit beta-like [Chiloscyllium plagiosum]XP_043535734.1 interleukin-2 receptor subunit beta-like [Chiloscyllium plagiosum]XP_043535735.1 interleukin-2 receptor subunit beta-like [Chiloscyllium plagiosum]